MMSDSTTPKPVDAETLRNIYLFQAFNAEQLDAMVKATERIRLGAGKRLFEQGSPIRRFFYVELGRMKLYRLSPEGYEKVIDLVEEGRTFAEAVVFMESASGYPVNADALESSRVLAFNAPVFLDLLRQSNESCLRLLGVMSRRLRWQVNEIDRLALQNATTRFIGFLLNPGSEGTVSDDRIELDVPKNVLASRLSIQPETFSRILSRLSASGLIQVENRAIKLLEPDKLRELLRSPN